MIILVAINAMMKLMLFGLNTFMLSRFSDRLNHKQRAGLSIVGSGCLLTLPLAFDPRGGFELWSPIVLVSGMLVFLWGSTNRLLAHEQANAAARRQARRRLTERGKL